jgi:hypothetical protein
VADRSPEQIVLWLSLQLGAKAVLGGNSWAADLDATLERSAAAAKAEAAAAGAVPVDQGGPIFDLWGKSTNEKMDALADVMVQAEIAANAERDLAEADEVEGDELFEDDADELSSGDTAPEDGQRSQSADELARELAQTRTELQRVSTADQRILHALPEISGYSKEANDRFRYENLRDKVLKGTASAEERREVNEMTQWHELAAPIYREAERQFQQTQNEWLTTIGNAWRHQFASAVKAEGLDDAPAERLYKSHDPIRVAIHLGRELERKRSTAKGASAGSTRVAAKKRAAAPKAAPRPKREPGWLGDVLDDLDERMRVVEQRANAQRDRELAEPEGRAPRRRSSAA